MTITRHQRACALGLTLAAAVAVTAMAETPTAPGAIRQLEGKAYALSDGHLMYLESHWLYDDHGNPSRLVLYRCPDGKPFARKRLHDDGYPQAPDFELHDARRGYREGVRSSNGQRIVFVRTSRSATERSASFSTAPMPVIDAGFDAYIRAHWNQLGQHGSDTVPFLIPSRLGTLKFSVKRLTDTVVNGRPAREYRLGLDSWIGFALPHIELAYDASTKELLRFVGLANIRSDSGDNVRARIVFDPSQDTTVSHANLLAAERAPLDGQCHIP